MTYKKAGVYILISEFFLARHKAHHAVVLARKYYGSGTGYDAVAEFGSMITVNDGHITIKTIDVLSL